MNDQVTNGRPQVGRGGRTSDLDKLWSEASAKYIVDQLGKIRESASKWGENATAILAVAGLATAFKGRETLEAIDPSMRPFLLLAVGVALLLSGGAILTAALATSGSTAWTWNDPTSFRTAQTNAANSAASWLTASKWLVTLAFLASVGAVALVWAAPKASGTPSQTLVLGGSEVQCGELKVANGTITVGGQPLPSGPVSVHTVAECPE